MPARSFFAVEEPTDAQLVYACLSGDDASLGLLLSRHMPRAYAYVARLIGPEDAEDAAQEGFIKAWRNLKKFDLRRPFRPWLYRILHNAALDLAKKRRPAAFSALAPDDAPSWLEEIEDPTPLPPELLARAEESGELARVLAALPIKQRAVLLLYHEEDMTFAEIGELLKEPLNTVKSRYRRALHALRAQLEMGSAENPEPPPLSPNA